MILCFRLSFLFPFIDLTFNSPKGYNTSSPLMSIVHGVLPLAECGDILRAFDESEYNIIWSTNYK